MAGKKIYKIMDSRGRVYIPKELRDQSKMQPGDIVKLMLSDGNVSVQKVELVEAGDQSPEAVEAFVRSAFRSMPDQTRINLISELTSLLQQNEGG